MFYVYILISKKDNGFYIGCTKDLKIRIREHNAGHVKSTKNRLPMELIYYEACLNQSDAFYRERADAVRREKYLKTYHGRMFLGKRLKSYLTG
jgi:putative endonuclease